MPPRELHILVIEDDASTRNSLVKLLTRKKHKVLAADTGQKALELARANPLDLVISDIGLPDTDGWALFHELRAHHPKVCGIALSGYTYAAEGDRSRDCGFSTHIPKPPEMATIESAIQQLFPTESV